MHVHTKKYMISISINQGLSCGISKTDNIPSTVVQLRVSSYFHGLTMQLNAVGENDAILSANEML